MIQTTQILARLTSI